MSLRFAALDHEPYPLHSPWMPVAPGAWRNPGKGDAPGPALLIKTSDSQVYPFALFLCCGPEDDPEWVVSGTFETFVDALAFYGDQRRETSWT
jgi:hypothetical protein